MYHLQEKMVHISICLHINEIWLVFSILLNIAAYSLYYLGYNNPDPKVEYNTKKFLWPQ